MVTLFTLLLKELITTMALSVADFQEGARLATRKLCLSSCLSQMSVCLCSRGGFNMPALRPVSMGPGVVFHPLDSSQKQEGGGFDFASPQSVQSNVSLKSELSDTESPEKHAKETAGTSDKEQLTDSIEVTEKSTGTSEWMSPTFYVLFYFSLDSLI